MEDSGIVKRFAATSLEILTNPQAFVRFIQSDLWAGLSGQGLVGTAGLGVEHEEATWPHVAPDSVFGPYPDEGSWRSGVFGWLLAQNIRPSSLALDRGKLREVRKHDTSTQTIDRATLDVGLGRHRRGHNDQASAYDF